MATTAERGSLLIADISGYTDYVVSSSLEYAEDVVSDITREVVERLEPIVRVNKLEGDDWRPFDYFTERMTLGRGVRVLMTTSLEEDGGVTRVVSRVKHEGAGRVAWLTAGPRLRRRLEDRYARLAKVLPTQIPSDRQLPLATPVAPPA